jgi:hypothetical protein
MTFPRFFQGWHYEKPFVYVLFDHLKRGSAWRERFKIALRHILPGDVLDVCAGIGTFRDFLGSGHDYTALDAGTAFLEHARRQGAGVICHDLHQGLPSGMTPVTNVVMIIALAQFRKTSAHRLLEEFKAAARRVVIVEEVLEVPRREDGFLQRCVDHLCRTSYYVPVTWFTRQEFRALMHKHGYRFVEGNGPYVVGTYGEHGVEAGA